MDVLLISLTEDMIGWMDDRYGRTAAWIVSVSAVLVLTSAALAMVAYLID